MSCNYLLLQLVCSSDGNSCILWRSSSRLGAAEDVYNTLNADAVYTEAQLISDFAINNIEGKFAENVGNGTYGSPGNRATIVSDFTNYLQTMN